MQQQVFNPLTDAQMIKQSLSKPKNLNTLIQIVTHRSNEQRQQIMQEYYHQYQINLHDEFLYNLSGNFKETIISLFYTPTDYDCYQIYNAVTGLGTNEETLIEIISSMTNEELNKIKQRYPQMYQRDLVELIKSETSGHLQKILITLLQADRMNKSARKVRKDFMIPRTEKKIICIILLFMSLHKNQGKNWPLFAKYIIIFIIGLYWKWLKVLLVVMEGEF